MQILQSPLKNFIYMVLSLLLSALITYYIIKKLNFKNHEIKSVNIKHSAIISLIVVSLTIAMYPLILIFIKKIIVNQLKISSNSGIGVIIYIIIALLEIAPAIIVTMLHNESLYSLGITKKNIFKAAFVGLISYFLYFLFIIILKHKCNYIFITGSSFSIWNLLNDLFTALGEEILFRGYVQYRLMKWLGEKKGLIVAVSIFCCSHVFQRMLGGMSITNAIISIISLFPVGLFLGYLFLKCKNVTSTIIFHTFYDFFITNM